ncbi:MAG: YncE family protein [Bacteroidota bacterium]|nr:YncE family protein [Bacteroidota bacterium]
MRNLNQKNSVLALLFIAVIFIFGSCKNDEDTTLKPGKGIFIVNEGGFGKNNGTISLFDPYSLTVISGLYESANNNVGPGDIVQSMSAFDNKGFIVVNNSQKIEVVDMSTFKKVQTISPLSYPRYVAKATSTEFYVSNGNSGDGTPGQVIVYNSNTYEVVKTITVGRGPERMLLVGNYMYVTNSGGYGTDNTVSVIDVTTKEVVKTITVGDNPVDIALDKDQNIWVFCKGKLDPNTWLPASNSAIVKIDSKTQAVVKTFDLGQQVPSYGNNLIAMSKDGASLYYDNGAIYKLSISATVLPTEKLINKDFYGIEVDPKNGNILGLESSASGKGKVYFYSATDGSLVGSYTVGYNPNSAVFNY